MANRFIGGVQSSRPQTTTPFVSRASIGTYFDNIGVLRTAPANQPRLNYAFDGTSWRNPAVLIESAATNGHPRSQNFTVSPWNTEYATVTNNNGVSPDGTSTAATFIPTAVNNFHRTAIGWSSVTGYGNGIWTASMFVKPYGYSFVSLRFDDGVTSVLGTTFNLSGTGSTSTGYYDANSAAGTPLSSSITPVGNGWYRIAVTTRVLLSTNVGLYFHVMSNATTTSFTADGSSGVYIWGAQVEQSYGATSYIPTSGSAVTRAQDNVGSGFSGIFSLEDVQNQTAIDDQFTVQSFTSTGTTTWTAPADVISVEVLVVAGGGAGAASTGNGCAGGGGAGGLIYNTSYPVIPGTTYPIIVGDGGTPSAAASTVTTSGRGNNSQFANLIAIGGGGGGAGDNGRGAVGGSGGGGSGTGGAAGLGTVSQGFPGAIGGQAGDQYTGGGGGAGGPGQIGNAGGGAGGPGLYINISGTSVAYAGGGGGGTQSGNTAGTGGIGGGGNGAISGAGTAGTANTGGGGGGNGKSSSTGGAGGSGIVIVKFKRTPKQLTSTSNAAVVVQKFTTSNTWTVPAGVTQVEALVVAGGGGGGYGSSGRTGGGGAGGVVYNSALSVTPGATYTIGVGTGGSGSPNNSRLASVSNGFGSGIGTGTELITNGSAFTVTTGWTATTATLSVPQTGTFRILPNASVNGTASQSITTVNGTTYVAVVKVTSDIAKFFRLYIGTTQTGNEITSFVTAWTGDSLDNGTSGAGFYSTTFTATGSTTWINMQVGGGTQQPTDISYISVRQASLPAFGGGGGGNASTDTSANVAGANGGSGGGGGATATTTGTFNGGTATQSVGFGNAGGAGVHQYGAWAGGGSGGGAGSAGRIALDISGYAPPGGSGIPFSVVGTPEYYAGGGGGSYYTGTVYGPGGIGGGGTGNSTGAGFNGASNTGGGGGAGGNGAGGNGGSGVVVLRYRVPQVAVFQDSGAWTCPSGVTSVQALIVAGGGGGGAGSTGSQLGGGGGGAGGLIYDNSIPVTPGQTYAVVVGQGGIGGVTGTRAGTQGGNSSFTNLIAIGGGYGGVRSVSESGGSGGSGGAGAGNPTTGGSGTYGQGNSGAGNSSASVFGGGGGGAGAVGSAGQASTEPTGGSGGAGLQFSIGGTATYYAGGGSSGAWGGDQIVPASLGGGGAGGPNRSSGYPGLQNTGGGGGGSGSGYRNVSVDTAATGNGAHGGSGIVILRWSGS